MHDSCFCVLHARARCDNKHGRDITSENKRIHRSFDPLVPDRTKTTKDDQIRTFPRREKRLCFLLRKNVISWPETTESERERENEQIEREIRTSLIPTSSSVCMCVPARKKESSVYYSSYFGSVEGEINSHHPSSYT